MLFVSLPPPLSRALLLAGYFTLSWAQLALPTWRKANITTSAAARTAFARAALQETIVHIGANGQFPDAADYVVPAIFYSQLAAFDAATGSQQYRDSLVQYFQNATMIHANFSNSENYGYAAVQAYVTYKDPVFLEYAIGVWNISNQYTLSQADIDAGRQKSGLKNFDLAQTCHGKTMAGGTFGITAVSDPSIAGLSTGQFAILSALLAASTSEPEYLAAAQLSIAFMQSHWLNPQNIMLDGISGRNNDSCSLTTALQPYDSGMAIEALAIVVDITKDSLSRSLLTSLIEAAITSTAWQKADGIISNQAHGSGGDVSIIRGLSAAYSRNVTTLPLREYIKGYLAVQASPPFTTNGLDENIYGHWVGPAATAFSSKDQTTALAVLVAAMGLQNDTQKPASSSQAVTFGGGLTSTGSTFSPSTTLSPSPPSAGHSNSHMGQLVGGIIAAVLTVILLICMGSLLYIRRLRKNSRRASISSRPDVLSVQIRPGINLRSTIEINPSTSPISQTASSVLTDTTNAPDIAKYGQWDWEKPPQLEQPRTRQWLSDQAERVYGYPTAIPASRGSALPTDGRMRILHSQYQRRDSTVFDDDEDPPGYPGTEMV
ncbi:Glycoside hydrolase family 76 protein [Mycena indigotica]|uniref:Glycoside hydrolase family 76 protein n=1 Tax=Mycena indigotica TaxID=2126181 RepID=A0A8H6TEU8_9AGAR|nr:Glycoside hydrolase family 76 protein [Mycena indigotica]KAF7316071.1 Glycoside hydrolase family 76 protein [Mycena indigotica]